MGQYEPPPQQPYPPPTLYPPQYQQPPQYPMQPSPAPKPRPRIPWLWVIGSLLVGLIIGYAVHVPPSSISTPSASSQQTTAANQPTQPSTNSTTSVHHVGDTVTSDVWQVTLHSVKASQGDGQFNVPKAGNVFLVADVTMKNTASTAQTASVIGQWSLIDADGHKYNADITTGNEPDGTVAGSQFIRGNVTFEVPKTQHQFTLQFLPGFDNTQLVQWSVSI